MSIRFDAADAHWRVAPLAGFSAAQLRFGDFEQGWKQYRWHEALPENHDLVRPDFPEWQGEPVAGRRFLLVGEQGLGDQIQFLRLAAWLNRQGRSSMCGLPRRWRSWHAAQAASAPYGSSHRRDRMISGAECSGCRSI